jgi:hypothetical protein
MQKMSHTHDGANEYFTVPGTRNFAGDALAIVLGQDLL